MLKAGVKRRRTQRQITDEKAEEALRQQAIDDKLAEFETLQQQLREAREQADNGKGAIFQLQNLLNNGQAQMDQNGNVQVIPQSVDNSEMSQRSQQIEMEDNGNPPSGFQIWCAYSSLFLFLLIDSSPQLLVEI